MTIKLIVATDLSGAIGYQNDLLFNVPEDMKHFKELTTGHIVVMGRKTFESLPNGALPNRSNVVLTTDIDYKNKIKDDTVTIEHHFMDIINKYRNSNQEKDLYVIGGETTYRLFYPYVDEIYLTKIHKRADKADSYFGFYDNFFELDLEYENKIVYSEKAECDVQFNKYKLIY